jgi:antitoxin component YwqK of YwqJK toxin-antitoxin module
MGTRGGRRLGVERLEGREVFASHLSATLSSGVLGIVGATAADHVVVQESGWQLSVQGAVIAAGKQILASVPLGQVSRIDVSFGGAVRSFTPAQGQPAATVELEDLTKAGKVDTLYRNGKGYQQTTFVASGGLVEQVTWGASGEVDTRYANGKVVSQHSWDASGNSIRWATWSASGKVETLYRDGKAYQMSTFDASGALVKRTAWGPSGEVDTVYGNGRVVQQTTWDAAGVNADQITWGPGGARVEVLFHNGRSHLRKTWDAAGDYTLETWLPTGHYSKQVWDAAGRLIENVP